MFTIPEPDVEKHILKVSTPIIFVRSPNIIRYMTFAPFLKFRDHFPWQRIWSTGGAPCSDNVELSVAMPFYHFFIFRYFMGAQLLECPVNHINSVKYCTSGWNNCHVTLYFRNQLSCVSNYYTSGWNSCHVSVNIVLQDETIVMCQ